jgi:signal transduction histidine kinase/CheY-like chemotaxis protein
MAETAATIRQGVSLDPDPVAAVRALHQTLNADASQPAVTIVFCSSAYDRAALEAAFRQYFSLGPLIGCTTAGELSHLGYTQHGLVGIAIPAEDCLVVSQLIRGISAFDPADGRAAAIALEQELRRRGGDPNPRNTFGMLMVDGLRFMEERVISALSASLGPMPLFGGSAACTLQSNETFVLYDGRFHADAAVLALFHTRLPFKLFSSHHFVGTAEQLIVTGADPDRRIISELNGETAALEYARLLGRDLSDLRSENTLLPPLMVRVGGTWYARSIRSLRPDNGLQLVCAIDEGVPLSIGDNTGMMDNLEGLFADVRRAVGLPQLVLGFDCVMRRVEAATVGVESKMLELFAANNVVGCSAFGEQFNGMHFNHTFTGVALGCRGGEPADVADPPVEETAVDRIERENAKLRKTVRVLLQRLERSMNVQGDTFSLFQNNVLLETTVRRRTEELAELNNQLKQELMLRRETEAALVAAKAEAEQANASKTAFLAGVSHDLQQPLNAARLLLGALLEEPLSTAGQALLGRIEAALEAAEEMLADFLEVSKLEAGGITPNPTQFAIAPVLAQLEAEYALQARRAGIALKVMPCSAVVRTDRALMQRVLRNLVANATRYTRRGRILIGCRRKQGRLVVGVYDTGIGIPQDKQLEVFKPFRRLAEGGRGQGSGLGLTIVENIARVLGLTVEVRSTEGRGSAFLVGLPLGEPVAAGPQANAAPRPAAALAGQTILVIDDDAMSKESLAAVLRAWGCLPMTAGSLAEGLKQLAEQAETPPQLCIADYHLGPNDTGLDALDAVAKAVGRAVPGLVVSADLSKATRDRVRRRGYEFLSKPINPSRLRSALTYLLCCLTDGRTG